MNVFSMATFLTVVAATTAASAPQTQAQPPPQSRSAPNAAPGSMKDAAISTTFAATAAQDGMVEVALAGLALQKSGDDQLRQLAEKMLQDYAESNGRLDSIIEREGLILPSELDAEHKGSIGRFYVKSGRVFEEAYLKHIAEKHSVAMATFESASMSRDPDIAAFARKGLSMLREQRLLADHLRAAIATKVVSAH